MPDRLLALDIGRDVGWATGNLGDPRPTRWDTVRLPGTSVNDIVAVRMHYLDRWLADSLLAWDITVIVIAERFRARTMREASASLALDGLVRMNALRHNARMLTQPENTVRKEILGRGSGKSDEMKQLAIGWCRRHDLVVANDHEADACVFWVWASRELIKDAVQAPETARGAAAASRLPPSAPAARRRPDRRRAAVRVASPADG
jgi:Holliday junction resolvasome RuvABC endonuclease subunit